MKRQWNKNAEEHATRTGERASDGIRRPVYMNKIAPQNMRQHLMSNQSRLSTAEDSAQEIEDHWDATQEFSCDDKGQGGFIAPVGFGPEKFGFQPERGEQRKFGGNCNRCWRIGHKEAQRWFKQEYMKSNPSRDPLQRHSREWSNTSEKGPGHSQPPHPRADHPFGIFVYCVVEVRAVVLEEDAFGVLPRSLRQERRQLFVGHKQMLPSSRNATCSVRILHCSVQKVQDVTPHCRLVDKLLDGIGLVEHLCCHHSRLRVTIYLPEWFVANTLELRERSLVWSRIVFAPVHFHKGVGDSSSFSPMSLFEHMSMGQARKPPTSGTTQCVSRARNHGISIGSRVQQDIDIAKAPPTLRSLCLNTVHV